MASASDGGINMVNMIMKTHAMNIITQQLLHIVLLAMLTVCAIAGEGITDGIDESGSTRYIIRLVNGDMLTGVVTEIVTSETKGNGIKLKTDIGIPTLYESEIAEIRIAEE
ncbi:MAG: hypothetical protein JNL32_11895, partial [Candidatus Kapabacteria bacterium]|nr:hypothetical protein [Candidatus Kapabacteria bacterium]